MNTKEYLGLYTRLKIRIKVKEEQLQELKTQAGHITRNYSSVQNKIKIGTVTGKIIDLENEIVQELSEMYDTLQDIENKIKSVKI